MIVHGAPLCPPIVIWGANVMHTEITLFWDQIHNNAPHIIKNNNNNLFAQT